MKKYFISIISSFFILSILSVSYIFAQNQNEEIDYSYGKIVNIATDKIEVTEYDYDKNEELNVSYGLDKDIEIRNAKSLKDLSVGDNIEIDYIIINNKKTAKVITLEKDSEEELDSP